ncbi:MAG: PqqD family protein [Lachnospiraceae bacterium]|nr:PqqD family protein [Lachnospiraceae bacterium]
MKIKSGFMLRKVAGKQVVVPVGKATLDFNGMITLNDSGAILWNCLLAGAEVEDMIAALQEVYDVDDATARASIDAFINRLKEADLFE